MYTKRLFKWTVADFSWFKTVRDALGSIGMIIFMPLVHKFHVADNAVILFASIGAVCASTLRGLTDGVGVYPFKT